MKQLVFIDIDGVLIEGQSQKLLLRFLFEKKKVKVILVIKIYLWYILYKINYIKDVDRIMGASYKLLKNVSVSDFNETINNFFNNIIKPRIRQQFESIMQQHKSYNRGIILISNTVQPLVDLIKDYVNADEGIGTKLESINGCYTGNLLGKALYGKQKEKIVIKYYNQYDLKGSFFYTDHHSDIPLLNLVGNKIIINPSRKLKVIAKNNGWDIKYLGI